MLKLREDYKGAEQMLRSASDFGLVKAGSKLKEFYEEQKQQEKKQSFVEKLGLEKPDEKPRSFLEAAQAGKYGKMKSPGGAHEL